MIERELAGVQKSQNRSLIRIERETQAEARRASGEYLDNLESLMDIPSEIRDGLLEEFVEPVYREKTLARWELPDEEKIAQDELFHKVIGSGTFMRLGYVPYGSEIIEKDCEGEIIENEKGLSCSIDHKVPRNMTIVIGDGRVVIPIHLRREKPFKFKQKTLEMEPNIAYTIDRAEAEIIDSQFR